ncbi:hypothetical protein EYZ11_009377 [Aspergillus tanneri]|uniref:Uncharacterized protein n=1 Tax=Aspergillus tanneri TaxID=1220188 RepID=A0A4V3UNG7_9EURO|nr:hypothetical protein EYZ11_009377 [Aspergillus tanneri]
MPWITTRWNPSLIARKGVEPPLEFSDALNHSLLHTYTEYWTIPGGTRLSTVAGKQQEQKFTNLAVIDQPSCARGLGLHRHFVFSNSFRMERVEGK